MASLIINNCYQVTLQGDCSGQAVDTVIGVQAENGMAQIVAQNVLTAFTRAGGPGVRLPQDYRLVNVRAVDLSSHNGEVANLSSTFRGSNLQQISTMGAAALIKLNSSTRNRSRNGRLYAGPLTEEQINGDGRTLINTSLTGWNTAWEQFRQDLAAANTRWGVISRKNASINLFTSITVSPIIATQRRRIRGRV